MEIRLTKNMSCYLLQFIWKFLQSNNLSDKKPQLWFGHDITIQMFFVSKGLFKDEVPLTVQIQYQFLKKKILFAIDGTYLGFVRKLFN